VYFLCVLEEMIKYKNWVDTFVHDSQRKIYYHTGKNEIESVRHYPHKLR
jgi:hypothetical protein